MSVGTKGLVLIIDDDTGVVHSLARLIEELDLDVDSAGNLKDGLKKAANQPFDIVLLDVNLPDGSGIDVIDDILSLPQAPQVIIMTAYSDPDGAELAIESGAWDYIQKPASSRDIRLQVLRALQYHEQKKQAAGHTPFEAPAIIGSSSLIQKCLAQASQIVSSDANVLITGETGTGKELFAKAIHDNSARRNGDFVVVDCSVLSDNLIESVLFGHEKGAFTGADRTRKGLVALANGGSLFLDEVGELPASVQSSFLRVLQEKTFRPVGSEKEVYSDFRVICATNKHLEQMASEHQFRPDLLYRLKTFVLNLPPLKDRKEDIALIAKDQIAKSCRAHDVSPKEISPDFVEALEKYDWPGNVRELINAVETSVTSAQFEHTLFAFHLPSKIRAAITRSQLSKVRSAGPDEAVPRFTPEFLTHKAAMQKAEKEYLESLYAATNGDIPRLLERTALSRTVLYRKLKQYHIR